MDEGIGNPQRCVSGGTAHLAADVVLLPRRGRIVHLEAKQAGLADHVVGEAEQLVIDHLQEIVDAWNKHFGG